MFIGASVRGVGGKGDLPVLLKKEDITRKSKDIPETREKKTNAIVNRRASFRTYGHVRTNGQSNLPLLHNTFLQTSVEFLFTPL